jgi:hypothetical protein
VTLQYKTATISLSPPIGFQGAQVRPFRNARAVRLREVDAAQGDRWLSTSGRGEIRLKGAAVSKPGPDRMMVFQEFD